MDVEERSSMPDKIPVTVLTGYLGAGKTTLLNRILSEPHGKKYAVIVNEFGEIGIDNDLIVNADEEVFEKTKLDAVVTVADARWLVDRLSDAPEAKNQIAFADVIVLNKTDLVSKAELAEVEARIRAINPYAKLHRTERCKVALSDVLERGAFDLDRILELEPEFLDAGDGHDHHGHEHHEHD